MATDVENNRFPSPQKRKRLQKIFEAAAKQDSLQKYEYAVSLYADCVRGDPGNYEYVSSFVTALHKRYGSVRKLGPMVQFKARGERAAMKKAISQKNWDEALQQGIEVLMVNPWDVHALKAMARPAAASSRMKACRPPSPTAIASFST